jgi:hypothetical protein
MQKITDKSYFDRTRTHNPCYKETISLSAANNRLAAVVQSGERIEPAKWDGMRFEL